jgi:hypothetical protein
MRRIAVRWTLAGHVFRVRFSAIVKHPLDWGNNQRQQSKTGAADHERPVRQAACDPLAAASHIDAAVVSPRIESSLAPRMIDPAPRKPTPVTMPWMTRDVASVYAPRVGSIVSSMNTADPSATSANVRKPAGLRRSSRSRPISAPTATAAPRRRRTTNQPLFADATLALK